MNSATCQGSSRRLRSGAYGGVTENGGVVGCMFFMFLIWQIVKKFTNTSCRLPNRHVTASHSPWRRSSTIAEYWCRWLEACRRSCIGLKGQNWVVTICSEHPMRGHLGPLHRCITPYQQLRELALSIGRFVNLLLPPTENCNTSR